MTIRRLPALPNITNRTGLSFEAAPAAAQRWDAAIRAADASGENTISILDPIGADFFGEGVTAKRISAALRSIGNEDVVVNMNSPGGDFFEGIAIYNLLQAHPKKVTMRILSMAASAASVIAMAGDEIQIAKSGFIMIHNAQAVAVGDRNDMREFADALQVFDEAMVGVYAARTGLDEKTIGKMMDKETFMSGQAAIDKGFVDDFLPSDAVAASARSELDLAPTVLLRRIDTIMAKAGVTRSERREMIKEIRGMPSATANGKPSAAEDAMRNAGVSAELSSVLASITIPLSN